MKTTGSDIYLPPRANPRARGRSLAASALGGKDAHVDRPQTRYATTDDDVHIAYQVAGDGPIDLVFVHAFVSHVELFWELPSFERFVRELSSWARVILFDKRGVGLSDRLTVVPTLEAHLDDLRTVLDAVDSERSLVIGNEAAGRDACRRFHRRPSVRRLTSCGGNRDGSDLAARNPWPHPVVGSNRASGEFARRCPGCSAQDSLFSEEPMMAVFERLDIRVPWDDV